MEYSSQLLEKAVYQISKLPGIGKKSALRLALHLLKQDEIYTHQLAESLTKLRNEIKYCQICHNHTDQDICQICSSNHRDHSIICVVENVLDVLSIENTAQFKGLYHVLGGIISPVNGIGPSNLNIDSLLGRITLETKEIIMALSSTMDGDTTAFYLTKKIKEKGCKVSSLARGIPIGGEIEYADEITLGRSILSRIIFE